MNNKIGLWVKRIGENACKASVLFSCGIMAQGIELENNPAKDFNTCVVRIAERAKSEGVSDQAISHALGKVKQIPRIIELDRRQPEFSQSFANYFNARISDERVHRGRQLLNRHRALLNQIQKETGIPGHFLISFWGLETSYGSQFGDWLITDSLATLACDSRRSTFFTQELINAMRIIDAGDISAERMIGSWAGAMGHMQFMPSTFLHYAKDVDGDGRRDLWGSVPDAFGSAANFLRQMGWTPGLTWGQEVRLPASFDYTLAGRGQMLTYAEWNKLGIRTALGEELPITSEQKTALLIPSGYQGPAFLITKNFQVIMRWNRSEYYALTVGHLADRIAGEGSLSRLPPPDSIKITREQIRQLQRDLSTLGIDAGEIDGVLGSATRQAISRFQQNTQRIADGYLDHGLLIAIRDAAKTKSTVAQ